MMKYHEALLQAQQNGNGEKALEFIREYFPQWHEMYMSLDDEPTDPRALAAYVAIVTYMRYGEQESKPELNLLPNSLKSQYEKLANESPLSAFENHTFSTAEMGGNYWAAQVAGKMLARATHHDRLCELAEWQDEEANIQSTKAWEAYHAFVDTFRSVHERRMKVNFKPTKRMVAIGNRDGVISHDLPYTDADMGRFGGGL